MPVKAVRFYAGAFRKRIVMFAVDMAGDLA